MARLPARQSIDERLASMVSPDSCPLCRFRADAAERYLDSLLWESVNDRDVRARLAKGGGFCRTHSGMLLEADRRSTGGSLGGAILLAAGLRQRLRGLEATSGQSRRTISRSLAEARRAPDCPVCTQIATAEQHAAERLVALATEPAWTIALGSAGFCLDDLALTWSVATRSDAHLRGWVGVGSAQVDRLGKLLDRLQGFIDHSSHDQLHLMSDEERASLGEATQALSGRQGKRRT
jgi:hypothetical protein